MTPIIRHSCKVEYTGFVASLIFIGVFTAAVLIETQGVALHATLPVKGYWETSQEKILYPTACGIGFLIALMALVLWMSAKKQLYLHRFLIPVCCMASCGVLFQAVAAREANHLAFNFHIVVSVAAGAVTAVAMRVIQPNKKLVYAGMCVLVVMALLNASPLSQEVNGSKLSVFGLQPGECYKASIPTLYLIALPNLTVETEDRKLLAAFLGTLSFLSFTLIFLCNDWGNGLIVTAITLCIIMCHWPKVGITLTAGGLCTLPLLLMSGKGQNRLGMVWDVLSNNSEAVWQLRRHQLGVLSSGMAGRGLSSPLYTRLSYASLNSSNDYSLLTFAALFGFSIALVFILMLLVFAYHCVTARDGGVHGQLARRIAVIPVLGQSLAAVGSELSLIPFMGQCIPFLSAGGSSLLSNSILVGVVISTCLPPSFGKQIRRKYLSRKKEV